MWAVSACDERLHSTTSGTQCPLTILPRPEVSAVAMWHPNAGQSQEEQMCCVSGRDRAVPSLVQHAVLSAAPALRELASN